MKRLKQLAVLYIAIILPLLLINYIYGVFTIRTTSLVNTFTISDKTSYKVIHQTMDLNGSTYTTVLEETFTNVSLGSVETPDVLTLTGFNSPATQTVAINTYNTVITYQYTRKQFNLTINDSQYVTTTTPSGQYYYGTTIHLVADPTDSINRPFAKWSNNETNRDYTFTLNEDTTIGPIYSNLYQVTFEPNNGDVQTTRTVIENQAMGDPPTVANNDCVSDTGTYQERMCTYFYRFEGWYLEPDFQTQINGDYVPTGNVTVYAKWNKVFYKNSNAETFDGNRILDTGVKLFSEENSDRNFTVEFTLDDFPTGQASRTVIFANMDETGEPYPGIQFRYFNNRYNVNANVEVGNKKNTSVNYTVGNKVILKRENGLFSYSLDGGNTFTYYNDYTMFTGFFDVTATFGGEYDGNGNPYRYMRGTISDIMIELSEYDTYTIHYEPNGGTGMMVDQNVKVDKTVNLNANTYVNDDLMFGEWNTEPDGSGTPYTNRQSVTGLANTGEVITLYAQWIEPIRYYVHFDPNGGSGTMDNQRFTYNDVPKELSPLEFTRTNYMFMGWNTEPDGSGTPYADREEVSNLTEIEDDVVILYAQWMKIAFSHTEAYTFDGVDDIIDTGVNLYLQQTIEKDFEIRFTVDSVATDVLNQTQPTIISVKDESNSKWPGFNVRLNNDSATLMKVVYKWNGGSGSSTTLTSVSTTNNPVTFIFKRKGGVVTVVYSYAGFESDELTLYNQGNWQLNQYFADNITFGGIYDSTHNPDRFFKGTISNMLILIDE